jgi:hypothetical protein
MSINPRSCWIILDRQHGANEIAERAGYYSLQEAEQEAAYLRKVSLLSPDSLEVIEITLQ